ncbi:MAG: TylF/MycF/NovP-related O-methyltransferase [Sterolibacterium sp.]
MKYQFKLKEIDTKGVEIFDSLVASVSRVEECGDMAKLVYKYSQSAQVKQYVKQRFTQYLLDNFPLLSMDEFGLQNQKLLNIYCNRAVKKLDISKDIDVFSEIAGRYIDEGVTLLHYDRLYTLFQAVRNSLAVDGDIVELGVYRGGSLKFIAEVLGTLGGKKKLVGFDTFKGHVVITDHDGQIHKVGMFKNTGGGEAVSAYIDDPRVSLVAGDASETFAEYAKGAQGGISLAHIDMDVYQPTADTLPIAFELLAPRGIILLDDYGFTSCPGAKQATDDFLRQVSVTSFHLLTGQMIIVK